MLRISLREIKHFEAKKNRQQRKKLKNKWYQLLDQPTATLITFLVIKVLSPEERCVAYPVGVQLILLMFYPPKGDA